MHKCIYVCMSDSQTTSRAILGGGHKARDRDSILGPTRVLMHDPCPLAYQHKLTVSHMCMYMYMYDHIYISIYICTFVRVYIYICLYTCIHLYVYMYIVI